MERKDENKRGIKLSIRTKYILMFTVFIILSSIAIGTMTYWISYNRVVSYYSATASNSAAMASFMTDGDLIDGWLENGADENYYDIQKRLEALKENFNIKYLYISVPVFDAAGNMLNNTKYVFDVSSGQEDSDLIGQLGEETGEIDVFDSIKAIFDTGQGMRTGVVTKSEFGYLVSAYEPLFSTSEPQKILGWVGADIDMSIVLDDVRYQTIQTLSVSIVIIILFAITMIVISTRQIIDPVHVISKSMENFVSDDESLNRVRIENIHTGDEIETMANSFNTMADNIEEYTTNLAKISADKERIATELNVATQIQASMLPCTFPAFPDVKEIDIFATMDPAKEVGGDFYDFFMIDPHNLCVVIADVSGKGIPAALFMVITRTLIKNQAQSGKSSSEVFAGVNSLLCENNGADMFVTAFMGILNLQTGKFDFSNAGHNPPFIIRKNNAVERVDNRPGLFLAAMETAKYRQYSLTMNQGDKLYMYTDGVTEALNIKEELYGEERLVQKLYANAELSPESVLINMKADIEEFAGEAEQADDITMLMLEYRQKQGDDSVNELVVSATLENLDTVLAFVEGALEEAECPAKVQIALVVAIEEIFVNIAQYAYGETGGDALIRSELLSEQHGMKFTFIDSGIKFNPLERKDPDITESAEERAIGGLGIYMVKKTADTIDYKYEDGQNIFSFTKLF